MTAWWQMYRKAFTAQECADLTAHFMTYPVKDAAIGYGATPVVNHQKRRSKVRWIPRNDPQLITFFAKIRDMAEAVNIKAFHFDIRLFHEVQFTEYSAEDEGHFDWHIDNNWKAKEANVRKLSMVMQLSDPAEYEGGKLEIENDPLPANTFTDQGDVIFFPSFNRHRVTPVTRGIRYSLVTWLKGPQFR